MSNSSYNLLGNNNQTISITNSIILNNYLIQNLILSPEQCDNMPINLINNFDKNQILFSPTPKKSVLRNILPYSVELPNIGKNRPYTSRLNHINIERISNTKKLKKKKPNLMPLSKILKNAQKIEKHPKDSKKKPNKKNTIFVRNNNKIRNPIKNSVSNKVLQTINSLSIESHKEYNEISFPRNSLSKKRKLTIRSSLICWQPKAKLDLKEFQFFEQIGKGTFGKIFSVKWTINNKNYAMKKEILTDIEEIAKRRNNCKIIQNFIKNTDNKGVINLYGNLCFKRNKIRNSSNKENINININIHNINEYIYYELMEKAERDWDKEISIRAQNNLYYTETELLNIMTQLITTLSLLEKNHITHRDIKPQNILVINGKYKLGDFGEIRVLKRDGLIVQRVRGSELYMSPILFHGLHLNSLQVRHNTYKSDVFSLGMCLFYAASLTYSGVDSIRELTDMIQIKNIIFQFLSKRFSEKLIDFICSMLEVNENKRDNFIKLEEKLKKL